MSEDRLAEAISGSSAHMCSWTGSCGVTARAWTGVAKVGFGRAKFGRSAHRFEFGDVLSGSDWRRFCAARQIDGGVACATRRLTLLCSVNPTGPPPGDTSSSSLNRLRCWSACGVCTNILGDGQPRSVLEVPSVVSYRARSHDSSEMMASLASTLTMGGADSESGGTGPSSSRKE